MSKYKAFVEAGAYDKAEYWTNLAFIKDGQQLSWKEALAEFRDRTGRPGPATWSGRNLPSRPGLAPVSGVSWFEAVAYSRFVARAWPRFSTGKRAPAFMSRGHRAVQQFLARSEPWQSEPTKAWDLRDSTTWPGTSKSGV